MKPEDKVLFACARQNFQEIHQHMVADLCRRYEINWEAVFNTADLHGIAPLIYVNLRQVSGQNPGIPAQIMSQLRQCLMHNISHKEYLTTSLSRALSFFNERSIEVMVIKGGALDLLVYDQPYFTVFDDVDIVISVRRAEITDREMWEFREFFHGSGIEYDFYEHHDVTMNGVLPVDFQRIWQDTAKISFRGQDVWIMSPEDMLISICINSCRKRFFRLRSLCNIAEIIAKYPDLNWAELLHKAYAYDCHLIVYTALLVTTMTIGCQLPAGLLEGLNVNPVRAKIMGYLSRQTSAEAFSLSYSGANKAGRQLGMSLLLPYASFRWYQIWRKAVFVLFFTDRGILRNLGWPFTLFQSSK